MKTLKIVSIFAILAGIAYGGLICFNGGIHFMSDISKAQTYENLLEPETKAYYSVESVTKKDGSTFIIGQKVKPMIGGKVAPQGQLVTIEVPPASGKTLMKGPFLTVNGGVTRYFNSESDVVQHALDN